MLFTENKCYKTYLLAHSLFYMLKIIKKNVCHPSYLVASLLINFVVFNKF